MRSLPRFSILTAALTFIGSAVVALVSPQRLAAMIELAPSPVGLMELRAVYGGFFLGLGAFFLLCAARESWFQAGVTAQACVMGGVVVVRVLSLLLVGTPSLVLAMLFALEATVLILGIVALRSLDRNTPARR